MGAPPLRVSPPSSVAGLLAQWYGSMIRTRRVLNDFTISTTPTRIVTADPSRVMLIISNYGTQSCALGAASNVTSNTGILLVPSSSIEMIWIEDLDFQCQEIWAISPAASAQLHIVETLLVGEFEVNQP